MMNKSRDSLNRIKKFFKLDAGPKEVTRMAQVHNLEESKSSKQGVFMRSWCANPESCLTDCQDYCKKLNS
jgi:hypothetical protein